jgi:pimeloyl-ACP methyl ester carboxylesterase
VVAGLILVAVIRRLRRRSPAARIQPDVFSTELIDVGRWTWRTHVSGEGPPLVLLHGLGANLYCWRSLAAILRSNYTVIIPDLPGFGGSSMHDDAGYGLDEQVDRLVSLLDRLKVDRALVVGNSMGGNIALWLALRHPGRVRAVASIAPAASPRLVPFDLNYVDWVAHPLSYLATSSAIEWMHGRTVSRRDLIDAERIQETLSTYGRKHGAIRSLLRATEAIRDPRLPDALAEITPPVMILWGSRDRLVSRAVIDRLETLLPHARSNVHIGGGHHLQEDEPAWTAEKLTSFFDEVQD